MLNNKQCGHPCEDYFNLGRCECTDFEEYEEYNEGEKDYSSEYYDWNDYDLELEDVTHWMLPDLPEDV